MPIVIRTIAIVIVLCLESAAQGNSTVVMELNRSIRDACRDIIEGIDKDAVIDVEIVPEVRQKTLLPGTATEIASSIVTGKEGLPQLRSITIRIYSKQGSLAKDVERLLLRQGKIYTPNTKVVVNAALTGFTRRAAPPAQLDLSPIKNVIEAFSSRVFFALSIVAGGILLLMLAAIDNARQHRRQINALMQSSQVIAQALDSMSQGSPRAQIVSGSSYEAQRPISLGNGAKVQDMLTEMSDASIAAVFSDAYWCQKDRYAANVWKRIPMSRKSVLLSGLKFSHDYATFLANVAEASENWEQHPYYLSPMPIWHIDNETLAMLVKEHPPLLNKLPPMRIEFLPITPSDMIALMQKAQIQEFTNFDWNTIPHSARRPLKTQTLLLSKSVADDEQLLSMKDVSTDNMRQITSLVWADRLNDEDLKDLLRGVSAVDLASAWVAPERILKRFAAALPEKKLKIVQSYLEKSTPDRGGLAFEMLHGLIIEQIGSAESRESLKSVS